MDLCIVDRLALSVPKEKREGFFFFEGEREGGWFLLGLLGVDLLSIHLDLVPSNGDLGGLKAFAFYKKDASLSFLERDAGFPFLVLLLGGGLGG